MPSDAAPIPCVRQSASQPAAGRRAAPGALRFALLIPALDEEHSIGELLARLPRERFQEIVVVDNGSKDRTAAVAKAAGARVVREPRRGYGQACQAGLAALDGNIDAVVFMDADLSDDPSDLERLLRFYESGDWDLVIGSRVLGEVEAGALTPLQRFGNALATQLIRALWGVAFSDLGPLRVIRQDALKRMGLRDTNFGWNVEMQARAAMLKMKTAEIPAHYHRRRFGKSKISGTLKGSFQAGIKIILTIARCKMSEGPLRNSARQDG